MLADRTGPSGANSEPAIGEIGGKPSHNAEATLDVLSARRKIFGIPKTTSVTQFGTFPVSGLSPNCVGSRRHKGPGVGRVLAGGQRAGQGGGRCRDGRSGDGTAWSSPPLRVRADGSSPALSGGC